MALSNQRLVTSASLLVSRREDAEAPYREKPSSYEVERFAQHVRKTGQPETFDKIERNPPPENSTPVVLRKFDVDRKLRPNGDEAPCAICSPFHPKCLHDMLLVWYPEEGVIRAIGPECGQRLTNSAAYKTAIADYERSERRRIAETTIEALLPASNSLSSEFEAMKPAIAEVTRLHKKLRRHGRPVVEILKKHKDTNGRLVLEVLDEHRGPGEDDTKNEWIGPAGYRSSHGSSSLRSHTVNFGPLMGRPLLAEKLEHDKFLDNYQSLAKTLPPCATRDEAFY